MGPGPQRRLNPVRMRCPQNWAVGRATYPAGLVHRAWRLAACRAPRENLREGSWVAHCGVAAWAGAGDSADYPPAGEDRPDPVPDYAVTRWCAVHHRNRGPLLTAKAEVGGAALAEDPGRVAVDHPPGAWSQA